MNRAEHWNTVYRTKGDHELSWYQPRPERSISLIESIRPLPRRAIDIGGGQSLLAGALIELGIEEVTVLDLAEAALERGRARLGDHAERVCWLQGDVLALPDLGAVELWHDRAVYHFLNDDDDRARYRDAVERSVVSGGHLLLATFAPDGPERCSGLPVRRYDAEGLAAAFRPAFSLVCDAAEEHLTPWGARQRFTYALLRRVG